MIPEEKEYAKISPEHKLLTTTAATAKQDLS